MTCSPRTLSFTPRLCSLHNRVGQRSQRTYTPSNFCSATPTSVIGQWFDARSAVLEFTAKLDGLYVNGVDIIHWNDEDKIASFKVMVRPLKAINLLHRLMGEELTRQANSGAKSQATPG